MLSSTKRHKSVAWGGFLLTILVSIGAAALIVRPGEGRSLDPGEVLSDVSLVLDAVVIALAGAVIGARLPNNPIGWLLLVAGLVLATQSLFNILTLLAYWTGTETLPGGFIAAWINQWIWVIPVLSLILLLHLFPTGSFLTRRWRWVAVATIAFFVVDAQAFAFSAQLNVMTQHGSVFVANRLGVFNFPAWVYPMLFVPFALALLGALGSMLMRFVRAQTVERQQIKWLLYAAALFVVADVLSPFVTAPIYQAFVSLLALGMPLAISIAVLRYHLFDIDVIIRKTLVYTLLTVLLGLVYFGSVVLLQELLGRLAGVGKSPLAIVVSTLVIAALFTPLRRRVQNVIDRRFYRKKYDAQRVLAEFALTARDETDLDALTAELARVVQETMQPERVSVWLKEIH
jgi:hypothetical protein